MCLCIATVEIRYFYKMLSSALNDCFRLALWTNPLQTRPFFSEKSKVIMFILKLKFNFKSSISMMFFALFALICSYFSFINTEKTSNIYLEDTCFDVENSSWNTMYSGKSFVHIISIRFYNISLYYKMLQTIKH